MVKVKMAHWPIVTMELDGLITLVDMEEFVTETEKLLAFAEKQPEKFGLIYIAQVSDEDHKKQRREKEAQKLSKQWFKANKGRIGEQCVGIAMVAKASGLMKMMKPIAKVTTKRMMGAPGDVFATKEEAEAWLAKKMAVA